MPSVGHWPTCQPTITAVLTAAGPELNCTQPRGQKNFFVVKEGTGIWFGVCLLNNGGWRSAHVFGGHPPAVAEPNVVGQFFFWGIAGIGESPGV